MHVNLAVNRERGLSYANAFHRGGTSHPRYDGWVCSQPTVENNSTYHGLAATTELHRPFTSANQGMTVSVCSAKGRRING